MPPAMDPATLRVWNALVSSWDVWLLTFTLAVVVPAWGHVRIRRLRIQNDLVPSARKKIALYVKIICWQWFLVAALLLVLGRHGLSVGAAMFGMAHAYQGIKGMLRTGFIGLQLAVLFVYVDSVIPGQVLHAGADVVTGLLLAMAASRNAAAATAPSG